MKTWIVAVATAFVLLGASVAPFLTPAWIHFEQARSGATGYVETGTAAGGLASQRWYADDIVHDLVIGGEFNVITARQEPLLTDAERSHMRDVRGVFAAFYLLVLLSVAALVVTWRQARGRDSRSAWWRDVRRGAAGLAVAIAALGVVSLFAFDAAFEVFHRLFFATGTYSFDPQTSHLVQLFPDQFWFDTTIVVGIVAFVASGAVAWIASRRRATRTAAVPLAPPIRVGQESR